MVDLCRSVSISSLIVKCSFFKENNTIKKGGAGVRDMKKKKGKTDLDFVPDLHWHKSVKEEKEKMVLRHLY